MCVCSTMHSVAELLKKTSNSGIFQQPNSIVPLLLTNIENLQVSSPYMCVQYNVVSVRRTMHNAADLLKKSTNSCLFQDPYSILRLLLHRYREFKGRFLSLMNLSVERIREILPTLHILYSSYSFHDTRYTGIYTCHDCKITSLHQRTASKSL